MIREAFSGFVKVLVCVFVFGLIMGGVMGTESEGNLQINGSFEYASNPDIPDYWTGMGRWTRSSNGIPGKMLTKENVTSFIEKFVLDDKVAYVGKRSLRVESPFFVSSSYMEVAAKNDYVISVYLKSSRENMVVNLSGVFRDRDKTYKTKKVSVSKEWKRYFIKLPAYPHAKLAIMVKPLDSGKLWVDAVQIEKGLTPTTFKPSHFDAGFTKPQQPIHLGLKGGLKTPSLRLNKLSGAVPVLDGDIGDPAWSNAAEFTMGTMVGAPSETPTKGKVLFDGKTIFIAFDCDDPRGANGKGESIEVFFDIFGIGSPYYQFIFTTDGKKYNFRSVNGKHEWDWKADWKVAIKKKKRGWTAEMSVPLSAMPDTAVVASLDTIKMNFCRNYSAGPELHLSWAPVHGTFLEPENFGTVHLNGNAKSLFAVDNVELLSTDATDDKFELRVDTKNSFEKETPLFATVVMETKNAPAQTRTARFAIKSGKTQMLKIKGFKLAGLRTRIDLTIVNEKGKVVKRIRQMLAIPHPMRIYAEYSYYTKEKDTRIKVEYDGKGNGKPVKLRISAKLAPLPRVLAKKEYDFQNIPNAIYTFPIKVLSKAHDYTLKAELLDVSGKTVATSDCGLTRLDSSITEARFNRFNRGVYLNGKPYIPYGYQIWLLGDKQLQFYKTLGHDYICYTGHWGNANRNHQFLGKCDELGLKVMDFHAVRAYADAPSKMLRELKNHKSLFAVTPVDESVDESVPTLLFEGKCANPYLICYKNDNVAGYRFWRNRFDGFTGDAVSIDRYPLIKLAKGLPQTTSLIYTFERALEMMDADSKLIRKPVFAWMEAAEAHSKEPTKEELVWLHYIAVVNHCMGFTYFGGVPLSRYVRATIKELDKELKTIQPFLYTFEEEPEVTAANSATKDYILILPKKLGDQLLVVCVNRATADVDAEIDLSSILKNAGANASVLFEGRRVKVGKDNILRDKFASLGRHVYKMKLKR